jgi:WD40 repeat protein
MKKKPALLLAEILVLTIILSCGISVDLGMATKTPKAPPTAAASKAPKTNPTPQPSNTPTQTLPTLTPTATASPTPLPPEEISLSNLERVQPVRSFASAGLLHSLSVSPDGQYLLIGTTNTIAMLTLVDLQSVWFIQPMYTPLSVVFSSDGAQLVVETKGGSVMRLDAATGSLLNTPIAQQKNVQFLALSPSGAYFAVTNYSDTTTVWETTNGAVIFKNNGQAYPGGLTGIQFSANDTALMIMGYDSKTLFQAQQWTIPTGAYRIGLTALGQQMTNWKYSPDGKRIFGIDTAKLTAQDSNVLMAWDAASGKSLPVVSREERIGDYLPSNDGSFVLVATKDNVIKQINVNSGSEIATFTGQNGPIVKMALSPDERQLITVDSAGNIQVWDMSSKAERLQTSIPPVARAGMAGFSADALLMVSPGIGTTSALVVDTTLASIKTNIAQPGAETIQVVAISNQGNLVAGCDRNNQITLWDAGSGEQLRQIASKARFRTTKLKFSPDDRWLASLSEGEIFVWDVESGERVQGFAGFEDMEFSPDGKSILAGNAEYGFAKYEIASGKRVASGMTNFKVTRLFHLPDGAFILVGGYRFGSPGNSLVSTIKLFNVDKLTPIEGEVAVEPAILLDAAVSPNNEVMATSDSYGNVHLWDYAEGAVITQFTALAYPPVKLAFNSDGTVLFAAGADGTLTSFSTIAAAQPDGSSGEAAVPSELILSEETYTHSSGAFSLQLPQGWKIEEGGSMGLSASAGDASGFIIVAAVNTGSEVKGKEFEALINNYNEMIKRSFSQVEIIDSGFDDDKGEAFTSRRVNISGIEYIDETYFTRDGANMQIVDFLSRVEWTETYLPAYTQIFASLVFNASAIQSKPVFDFTETVKGTDNLFKFDAPALWGVMKNDDEGTTVYAYKSIEDPSKALVSSLFLKGDGQNVYSDAIMETAAANLLQSMGFDPALSKKQVLENGDLRFEFVSTVEQMEGVVICSSFGTKAHFLILSYKIDSRDKYQPLMKYLESQYIHTP